jgi:hypothetical protein
MTKRKKNEQDPWTRARQAAYERGARDTAQDYSARLKRQEDRIHKLEEEAAERERRARQQGERAIDAKAKAIQALCAAADVLRALRTPQ